MPAITVADETYARLAEQAAAVGVSVDDYVAPVLDQAARRNAAPTATPVDLPEDEWRKESEAFLARARARADLYPPGFQADVSRESIYEGCGE